MHFAPPLARRGVSLRHAREALAMAAFAFVCLGGCASFRGAPEPVVAPRDRLAETQRLSEYQALMNYYAADSNSRGGLDPASYRNIVTDIYMAAADARYEQYKANLSREIRGYSFGSNALVLLLNGIAVVSGAEGARALAAASAVTSGTSAALSKEVFYDKTLQALFAAMDGNRTEVKIRIRIGLKQPALQYGLRDALDDVRDLEAQASMDAAIQQLTTLATNDTADKKEVLKTLYSAPVLTQAQVDTMSAIVRYVTSLSKSGTPTDVHTLNAIASAAGVDVGPTPRKTRNNIVDWLNHPAQTEDLDSVVALLKPITNKDSY
jgi:hypothetical protein